MALTWAGVITILFLAAACVRGYRRGLIKELGSLVCVLVISKKSYNRSITSQSGNLDRKTVVCYGRNKR